MLRSNYTSKNDKHAVNTLSLDRKYNVNKLER